MTYEQRKNLDLLVEFFKDQGLTQEDIAARLGVSQAHVNQLLNGKTPFGKKTASKWASTFGVSAAWLLTGEGEMLMAGCVQNNQSGDNFNGEQIVHKNVDTHDFISLLKKKDEQIDRLLALLEQAQNNDQK